MSEERNWPEIGCRVVRGNDWKWQNQDGGEGHMGTVVYFKDNGKIAMVYWDHGDLANYRCSDQVGGYDLLIVDSGPAGIKHGDGIFCDSCRTKPIYGARWICLPCTKANDRQSYDMCSDCYHSNKHDLEHNFIRVDYPGAEPDLQKPRAVHFRKDAIGIVPGAVVVRGRDWRYADQDGGVGKSGVVTKFNDSEDNSRDSIRVRWTAGGSNVYRLGANGNVDVKCHTPEVLMRYYKEHLPKLGANRKSSGENQVRPRQAARGDSSDDAATLLARLLLLGALSDALK